MVVTREFIAVKPSTQSEYVPVAYWLSTLWYSGKGWLAN